MVVLEVCIFVIVIIGFLGLIYKFNVFMKIIVMDVMGIGVIVYYCLIVFCIGFFIFIVISQEFIIFYVDFVF